MKKFIRSSRFMAYALLTVLFVSCEQKIIKNEVVVPLYQTDNKFLLDKTTSGISKETYEMQVKYAETHLKVLGSAIIQLARYDEFVKKVNSEVNKKFDGDFDVLIENIISKHTFSNRELQSMIEALRNSDEFQKSLNAFKGIDDRNYFPQVHVPFLDSKKMQQSNPKVVFLVVDKQEKYADSFDFNEGKFVKTGSLDEAFAKDNLVWVISINEKT